MDDDDISDSDSDTENTSIQDPDEEEDYDSMPELIDADDGRVYTITARVASIRV